VLYWGRRGPRGAARDGESQGYGSGPGLGGGCTLAFSRWLGPLVQGLLGRVWPSRSFCKAVASRWMDRLLSAPAPGQSPERAVGTPDIREGTPAQKTLLAPHWRDHPQL